MAAPVASSAPPASLEGMVKVHQYTVSGATTFAQFGAVEAYTGDQGVVDEMVASFDRRRRIIVDGLRSIRGITCPEPRGAFYAFPNVLGTGKTSTELADNSSFDVTVASEICWPDYAIVPRAKR